jgi:CheY-like chemotaxis protein
MTELKKIMHVDDDADILEVARLALEGVKGFEVASCSGWREVVEVAPAFRPDLFLLDVMMPEKTGPETLEELRKLPGFQDTPTIYMTAKVDRDTVRQLQATGAITVIPKPFDPLILGDEIQEEWEKAHGLPA